MREYISDLRDQRPERVQQIMDTILRDPIIALLSEHGPLAQKGLQYFLDTQYDIHVPYDSIIFAMSVLLEDNEVEKFWFDAEYGYSLPGQDPTPRIPVPADYANGYYALYQRLQFIRNNPELWNMADEYIDALYNPEMQKESRA